jgi:hypothetical protein
MSNTELNNFLKQSLDLSIHENDSVENIYKILSGYINELIEKDFNRLLFLLYKIDVSEVKLKQILKEQPDENAGQIIAKLIIERQLQKIAIKKSFGNKNGEDKEGDW